jgi:hypothetical protein
LTKISLYGSIFSISENKRIYMTKEERLDKVTTDFSALPEEKQEYILGVLQALVFANNEGKKEKAEPADSGVKAHAD